MFRNMPAPRPSWLTLMLVLGVALPLSLLASVVIAPNFSGDFFSPGFADSVSIFNVSQVSRPMDEATRKKLWQEVETANQNGLPKTAIENLNLIYQDALQDEAYPEAVRALATRCITEASIEQPLIPNAIRRLESALPDLPATIQPVVKTLLADWYFSYYQQNRWRFAQRSQTATPPSEDFETWDLPRFLTHVDGLYRAALSDATTLQSTPIETYAPLLSSASVSDAHRPTLFDFVAYQALQFYALDEQIVRQQAAFDVSAASPVFSPLPDFLAWQLSADDDDSFLLQALKIQQALLKFHAADDDPTALLDANLNRFQFGNQVAVGSEKTARYQAALQGFADQHSQHPLSSLALGYLATSIHGEGDSVKARQVAMIGLNRFKDSPGGAMCHNLIATIEAKELQIVTERVWNSAGPQIEISYRNLNKVYFRLVKFDYDNWRWGERRDPSNLDYNQRLAVFQQAAVAQWSADLPQTSDYKTAYHQVEAKFDLPSGCYLLLASATEEFSETANQLAMAEVWVSRLALILHNDYTSPTSVGQVVDALSGQPVVEAKVQLKTWEQDGRNSSEKKLADVRTDAQGFFQYPKNQQYRAYKFVVSHQDQTLGWVDQSGYYRANRRERALQQTLFFTDRSIYRPGQTIQFKGVLVFADQNNNSYSAKANQPVTVELLDVNSEKIEELKLVSNAYGSISGSFTAPANRATGMMYLRTVGTPFNGQGNFRVEEYKRPKFLVDVETPTQPFQLNEKVTVNGKATAYTGAPIDGAQVAYRVVREVRYPAWWMYRCWYCPPVNGQSQEIANGTTVTQVDGTFQVPFTALPDASVDRASQPIFTYTVYADVTDTTGETRSDNTSLRLGYQSLQASLSTKNWLTVGQEVSIAISVSNLDGKGQAAQGKLQVFALQAPASVQRAELQGLTNLRNQVYMDLYRNGAQPAAGAVTPDLSQIQNWPLGDELENVAVETGGEGQAKPGFDLPVGAFRARFTTVDSGGNEITAEHTFMVIDPAANALAIKIPHLLDAESWSTEPGQEFNAIWGTGYGQGRAFVQWIHRGKVLESYWTPADQTQTQIKFKPTEEHRGGVHLVLSYVRDNRLYTQTRRLEVPWTQQQLSVKWEHFVSKLTPGGKETWTAVVSGPDSEKAVAEMVATLYDASLDAFAPHNWLTAFNVFYSDSLPLNLVFSNRVQYVQAVLNNWPNNYRSVDLTYRQFIPEVQMGNYGMMFGAGGRAGRAMMRSETASAMPMAMGAAMDESIMEGAAMGGAAMEKSAMTRSDAGGEAALGLNQAASANIDLSQVSARTNLNETAFFFPNLIADQDGSMRLEFEVPEALTEWKFMGFAHDAQLRSGYISDKAVTSKDLMVQPNPPRFLREGDSLAFSVKVSNQSPTVQTGQVSLTFTDLQSGQNADSLLKNDSTVQRFEIPAGQSKSFYWTVQVPDFVGALGYKAVAATGQLSDGEEGFLPVLSRRILVTESLPLPIRGTQTKDFTFESLLKSADSDTLQNQSLTVQMTSNPSWYAVMALPYLMEYPHQCSEQVFNRLYANALGQHIVNSDERIDRVFQQWRTSDALDSPLEKNRDLRNVLLEESPWLDDAKQESQARRNVGVLFDKNRLQAELARAANQLAEMQYSDGAWPWFPGGQANDYITLYVTTGFGRLRHLNVPVDIAPAVKSLDRLDQWIDRSYQEIVRRGDQEKNNLNPTLCLYLYGRSFFLQDKAVDAQYQPAIDYFLGQAKQHWVDLGSRQPQGHLAVALKRFGDLETPQKILASLTQRSVSDEELGMFWRDPQASWWWYQAPIETQALLIEAYDEVLGDQAKVEDLKVWLLKQKQTQNWKTTKATADAVYALLLRGTSQLASQELVSVSLAGQTIKPTQTEAGTGFYQQRFIRGEIAAEMGNITVTKKDAGVAWGSVHWQYLEDISKIKAYQGTPLTVKKSLYIKQNSPNGPVISQVNGPVAVGDELVVRVELRSDRDMEYLHLKDYRGSGTEPVNVLSSYKFREGLAYYESTKDTASHFFIDYLPRGVYVFEYSLRIQHRGTYETGIAELQCMYAPEFNSHSQSIPIVVE